MVEIFVDADACPVKDEIMRVADRHGLKTYLVCDGGLRPSQYPQAELVIVTQGSDAADDWIADHIQDADVCVTNDIPLAARCLKQGALALKPDGEPYTENSIGAALATRDLMQVLREGGETIGGPRPFNQSDRSAFLDHLETIVQAAKRQSDRQ